MDNSTTQTNNLPSDLKEAIYSQKVYETLLSISKKFDLSIDQEGEMESETKLVMMGNTHPSKFVANLEERLEIDREKPRLIAADINELVFKPVRLSLRKIHNIRDEGIMTAESTKATGTVEKLPPPQPPLTRQEHSLEKLSHFLSPAEILVLQFPRRMRVNLPFREIN